MSFGAKPDMDMIRLFAAFAYFDELKKLKPPMAASFTDFRPNAAPTHESIMKFIALDYPDVRLNPKKTKREQERAQQRHQIQCETEGRRLASFLLGQWPNALPSAENFKLDLLDGKLAVERVLPEWQHFQRNVQLSEYVRQIQKIMLYHEGLDDLPVPQPWNHKVVGFNVSRSGTTLPIISDLLAGNVPLSPSAPKQKAVTDHESPNIGKPLSKRNGIAPKTRLTEEMVELRKILDLFGKSTDILRQQYGRDLKKSLVALHNCSSQQIQNLPPRVDVIKKDIETTRAAVKHELERLQNIFSAADKRYHWLHSTGLWPCTSPIAILELLRSSANHKFGHNVKNYLLSYGVSITTLQRLLRVRHAQLKMDEHRLLQEWRYKGHENWNVSDYPDWLLLEIESDILIRPEQIEVAHAIITPVSGANSVLQMNMGKGTCSEGSSL
jgi:hypothetical protein